MHAARHARSTSFHWRSSGRRGMPPSSCSRCASEYGSSGVAAQPGRRRHDSRSRSTNSAIASERAAAVLAEAFGGGLARMNASNPWPDFLGRSNSPGGDTRHSRSEMRYW